MAGANIGDLLMRVVADLKGFSTSIEVAGAKAGDKAGAATGKSFGSKFTKTLKGGLKGGILQGLGLGVGIGAVGAATAAIGAIGSALKGAIDDAIAFERAMANVNSIAKFTDQELAEASAAVIELSKEFGQSALTMAEGLYDITSSGFEGAEALQVLEAASLAATAGLSDTATASSGIAAVLNAYGLSAEEATRVSDIMFQTVNRGVITFPELADQIGKTTALSAPLGVSLEEVAAAVSLMTRNGVGAEETFTQINAVMNSMLKPSQEAAELAADLGLEWDATALRTNGLVGQVQKLIVATGGSHEKMATLLGDSRAIRGAFVLAKDAGEEFSTELGIMEESAGAAGAAFAVQADTVDFKVKQTEAAIGAFSTQMGTQFILGLGAFLEFLDEAATGISDFLDFVTPWDEYMTVAEEKAKAMAHTVSEEVRHNLKGPVTTALEDTGAAAGNMAQEFDDAATDTVESFQQMVDRLTQEADRLIDDVHDPAIQAAELVAKEEELAALERIATAEGVSEAFKEQALADADTDKERKAARKLVTDEEIADAERRKLEVAKQYDELRLEMLTSGNLTAKDTDKWLGQLEEDYRTATGKAKKKIGELIAKIKELRGQAAKGITVRITFGKYEGKSLGEERRASGGPMKEGKPYLVGEEGPELMFPDTSGFLANASQTAAMMDGSSGGSAGGNTYQVALPETVSYESPRDVIDAMKMLGERGYMG
ncbi:MAG TPA: phage tail tape measure protein [Actinomycetota bacterium]